MTRAIAALVLVAAVGCGREAPSTEETVARDRFIRELAAREGLTDLWYLVSRGDVVFEDGFAEMLMVDPDIAPRWNQVPSGEPVRAIAGRWIGASAHVRVRGGGGAMTLHIWGRTNPKRLFTRPRISATFDGRELASRVVGDDGVFVIEAAIPAERLHGWSDVYLNLSSIHEPWRDPTALRVALVEGVSWEPAR